MSFILDISVSSSEDDRLPEPADLHDARPDITTASHVGTMRQAAVAGAWPELPSHLDIMVSCEVMQIHFLPSMQARIFPDGLVRS